MAEGAAATAQPQQRGSYEQGQRSRFGRRRGAGIECSFLDEAPV